MKQKSLGLIAKELRVLSVALSNTGGIIPTKKCIETKMFDVQDPMGLLRDGYLIMIGEEDQFNSTNYQITKKGIKYAKAIEKFANKYH